MIKKAVALAATPLFFTLALAVLAAILRAFGHRRLALWMFGSAVALLYLAALPPVADALLGPLESEYPALEQAPSPPVAYVVVLGSGYYPRRGVPVTGALEEDGLARIVEGVRLVRRFKATHLIVSGGTGVSRVPTAQGYEKLAIELGVDRSTISLLESPRDTDSEAAEIARMLGKTSFVLVTSAYHMPRAMRLMKRAGAEPIAAPTAQSVRFGVKHHWGYWLPGTQALRRTERALHEYLGLVWMSMARGS